VKFWRRIYDASPLLRPAFRFGLRARTAFRYIRVPMAAIPRWLVTSRETTNFTFDLTDHNMQYLTAFVAEITRCDYDTIAGYVGEIEGDHELKRHILTRTREHPGRATADAEVRLGKRIGWYAFVRATKPRIVVETGVDKGLGSCVLVAGLRRNAQEGHPGYYYGTDINPRAGYLLSGVYQEHGRILYGDSLASLRQLTGPVDLFINDSDHSAEYEEQEYDVIQHKLAPGALVLGDNAHGTDRLFQFARRTGRAFLFFQEKPRNHWYPGGGIGVAFHSERAPVEDAPAPS
jgi:predicted O-methyltransferase YrrM